MVPLSDLVVWDVRLAALSPGWIKYIITQNRSKSNISTGCHLVGQKLKRITRFVVDFDFADDGIVNAVEHFFYLCIGYDAEHV